MPCLGRAGMGRAVDPKKGLTFPSIGILHLWKAILDASDFATGCRGALKSAGLSEDSTPFFRLQGLGFTA